MFKKYFNLFLIVFIILIIVGETVRKVSVKHNDDLWKVTNKMVIEASLRCKRESVCLEDTATLDFLIEQGYLDRVVDPISKEYISNDSYVNFNDNDFVIKK